MEENQQSEVQTQEIQTPYAPSPIEPKHRKPRTSGEVAYRILEIVVGTGFLAAGCFLYSASLVMGLVCGAMAGLLFWGRKRP